MLKLKFFFVFIFFFCVSALISCNLISCTKIHEDSITNFRDVSHKEGLKPDPQLIQGRLSNGFTYILLKNSYPENRVSMHLDIQAGSMNETEEERGVAHYLEHMLFNGSTHFKPDELVEYFQSIGMRFGADANAHTGFFETVYDIFLPSGDSSSMDKGLLVLDDFARGALLLESEVERERGVILAEKRERDSVAYRTFEATLGFELEGSRIAQRLPIGTQEVIAKADQSLLKGYYDTWYRPDNMVLVLVGDFDAETAKTLITERFSGMIPRAPQKVLPDDTWTEFERDRAFYSFDPEAGNTTITIEMVTRAPFETETLEKFKETTKRDIAEAIVQNRLSRIVRKKGSPLSDSGIFSGDFFQGVHFSAITAESDPEEWEKTLEILETTLRRVMDFGFSDQELDRVKADFIQELTTDVSEASTRKSSDLARQIIRQTNNKLIFQSPGQRYDILVPYIKSLTQKDVLQAFRDIWPKGPTLVLVTGNAQIASKDKSLAEKVILNAFQKSRAKEVIPGKEHRQISFPYLPEPQFRGAITSREEIEDLGILRVEFENNVKLSLKPTEFKKGEFLFKISFGQGRKKEPELLPGLALLCTSVMNESGFGGIDKDQLEEALAGRNVKIHFNADEGSFFIQGSAGPDEITLVFQLASNYFLDPAFRAPALALAKERYRQLYRQLMATPEGVMELTGEKFLANGDSRFGLPPLSTVESISLGDVESWVRPFLNTSDVEISVVGDFDKDALVNEAAKYMGTLPRQDAIPFESNRPDPGFPAGKTLELTVDTVLKKALVQICFPTDDFWEIGNTRRLNILAEIFSERLRKDIREKLGASYSPYAYNDPSHEYKGYGFLRTVVSVAPDKTKMVIREIEEITASLAAKGVDKKEVELACKPIITHIRDMKKNNGYWLESVLAGSWTHPEKIDWARHIMDDYKSITVSEINDFAEKYFNKKKGASITIRPLD